MEWNAMHVLHSWQIQLTLTLTPYSDSSDRSRAQRRAFLFHLQPVLDIFYLFPSTLMMSPLSSEGVSKATFVLFLSPLMFYSLRFLNPQTEHPFTAFAAINTTEGWVHHQKNRKNRTAHVLLTDSSWIDLVSAGQTGWNLQGWNESRKYLNW